MSSILYGAPIWVDAIKSTNNKKRLLKAQRPMALCIARAYRSGSSEASLVIAGLIPIDVLTEETKRIFKLKNKNKTSLNLERKKTIPVWQNRWEQTMCSSWTKECITNIDKWINRKHGNIFEISQTLSTTGYCEVTSKE